MGRLHSQLINQKRKDKKRIKLQKKLRAEEIGKVKKAEVVPALRQRAGITLLDPKEGPIPNCPHGPCLLFTDGKKKWFGCAVYRSDDLCKYKAAVGDDGTFEYMETKPVKFEYGDGVLSKIKAGGNQKLTNIYWCSTCSSYVNIPHKDPVQGPLKAKDISKSPSELLFASKCSKGLSQHWFTPNVLTVVNNVLHHFDSILCVGCPSIFEGLWGEKNAFLLDLDHRFSNFYSENDFAHYSLMNNHFYQGDGKECLMSFFKKAKSLCIVIDPPFGVILSALEKSLSILKQLFLSIHSKGQVASIVFLPIFVGKHLNGMSIIDYKVTYSNHAQFKHPNKTIVRMFTDIDRKLFNLPVDEGYRFCKVCQLYASKRHCDECKRCTINIFGPTRHCSQCEKCVKLPYAHCDKCQRCHLPKRCIK